ncbi:MAG: hypothetical protein OXH61_11260 [Acidimicrobiaceae bacterium]|nr:hypothetical protein [Acidimicrobiaceae bacterium]
MLLAHQGGWDEILAVGAPMVLLGSLLLVARRRARAHKENRHKEIRQTEIRQTEINND